MDIKAEVTALREDHLKQPGRRSVTAIGLEGAVWIWRCLDGLASDSAGSISVLDLGSGFSSVVIRRWAATNGGGNGVRCVSVDHLPQWCEATAAECRRLGLDDTEFYTWGEFRGILGGCTFDLVFVDMDGPAMRVSEFDVYERCSDFLLFDDWQFAHLRDPLLPKLSRAGFTVRDLEEETRDQHGRWLAEARR